MPNKFITILRRISPLNNDFPVILRDLENAYRELHEFYLEKVFQNRESTKNDAIKTLNNILFEEKHILELKDMYHKELQEQVAGYNDITKMKPEEISQELESYDPGYMQRLEDSYEVLQWITEAKSMIVEFLADYFPEDTIKNAALLAMVKDLIPKYDPTRIRIDKMASSKEQSPSPLPIPVKIMITFDKPSTKEALYNELIHLFQGSEEELKNALNGERLPQPILFPDNQNKFVELFRRTKYNGLVTSRYTELQDWICTNFQFHYKRGETEEIRKFNKSTVWDILTKGKGEPPKNERICNVEWLPYKSPSLLLREKQSEKR